MAEALAPVAGLDEPDPVTCPGAPAPDVPEFEEFAVDDAFEELEELDGALPCAPGAWDAGALLAPPEPFAEDAPTFCRTLKKLCGDAFDDVELAGAGGVELGAIIVSRIASVMNRAARTSALLCGWTSAKPGPFR
ncbi:MAG: hypothetical protein JO128_03610 [Alphaproteobacteria bacterium]|nr:hypothetical protein [Alphaproteobacteria bacterium]